jgi:flagellin
MPFSIQTNVNSLIAQENLRVNSNFQNQTIQRLTSGYRINSSGDDAAGLAIANKFRSDTAELSQGVRNANDGVAQLQIMDGGMNNIGKMLDRLKTLATQSASATFTGNRSVLNSEYQSLITEIDRQAQGIGLSTGGHFAAKMGVYVGGGTTAAGTADTANGTIDLDLTHSSVDTKALGLRTADFEVTTKTGVDISSGSTTSVSAIDSANTAIDGGKATFYLSGPGFSAIQVDVNISGMTKPQDVVDAINTAINATANTDANLLDAGISASVKKNSDGTQQLVFSSTGSAFQVQAGTKTANALLGNFKTGTGVAAGTGADVAATFEGKGMTKAADDETVVLRITLDGVAHDFDVTVSKDDAKTGNGANTLVKDVNDATDQDGNSLSDIGITFSEDNEKLKFVGPDGKSMQISVAGDQFNALGLGSWQGDFATDSYGTGAGTATFGAGTAVLEFSINGGDTIAVTVDTTDVDSVMDAINTAAGVNDTLKAAGIGATSTAADDITIASDNNTNFRINVTSRTNVAVDMQLGGATNKGGNQVSSLGSNLALPASGAQVETSGSAMTGLGQDNDVFSFKAMLNTGDQQTIGLSALDDNGEVQATSITLSTALGNADTIDEAIDSINDQLQSNDTLKHVVAVKEINVAGTAQGIRFISSLSSFNVKVGAADNFTDANPVGMYDGTGGATSKQGMTVTSSASGNMDISTIAGAQQAVIALGEAVTKLGSAQAAVGKGQNQLNYAIGLAQSQISNFSAAESRIRDADVASEAANLTKAQVLQQASMAAMAQANSAPQAVLSLLKG